MADVEYKRLIPLGEWIDRARPSSRALADEDREAVIGEVFFEPAERRQLFIDGSIKGLPEEVVEVVATNHRDDALAITAVDGIPNSVWIRANVKDLVWYRPDVFAAGGYAIPGTWGDLLSLSQQMEDDGLTPWCMGLEAYGASGWPGTDWVEQIMLGSFAPDVYDDWVAGDIAFTDDRVRDAADLYATVALMPGWAVGGRRGVLTTSTATAVLPMLEDPPQCAMYRQASFNSLRLPAGTTIGPNGAVDVFRMPAFPDIDPPLHVGGDFAVALNSEPDVWELMAYLATPESSEIWPEETGNVAPQVTFDITRYDDPFSRRIADMLTTAEEVRFDGSDQMPTNVGKAFNEGMLTLISTGNVDTATTAIQSVVDAEAASPPAP